VSTLASLAGRRTATATRSYISEKRPGSVCRNWIPAGDLTGRPKPWLNRPVLEESIHCVVTSCENTVAWRRVLHLLRADAGDLGDAETGGLIADVSVYLCGEHRDAEGRLTAPEPFPPERPDDP
jgi:hypothetical protein